MQVSKILTSGFAGLGDLFSQKVAPSVQTYQNTQTPVSRPIASPGFSFNFASAAQKLIQPFQKITNPKSAAGASIITSAGDTISDIIRAGGNKVVSALNKSNEHPTVIITPQITENGNASQNSGIGQSISSILAGFKSGSSSNSNNQSIAEQAAVNSGRNVMLFGAIALSLTFIFLAKGK